MLLRTNLDLASKEKRHVLPNVIYPSEYWLHITPNFDDFTFKGSVRIHIHALKHAASINLNAVNLILDSVTVQKGSQPKGGGDIEQQIEIEKVSMNTTNGVLTIPLDEGALHAEEDAYLNIQYKGTITDDLVGFYRSKYRSIDGRDVYVATTQFEPVDARRAFPCWDEPSHKAVFHIKITAPSHMVCLSNMHVQCDEAVVGNGGDVRLTTRTFAPTPRMSTYLVAWTIGELDSISTIVRLPTTPEQETIVSVYTPKGKSSLAHFALDVTVRVLPLYEFFFEQGYLLKKLDLVAIPDFGAGAMENWGLITYREETLLCDENSAVNHRQRVALIVCHEVAHQWFGNLVTMEWWSELWLNEAFATFMQYWATNKLFPEWDVFMDFVEGESKSAMKLDAMKSSHPIEVEVASAQEIDEIFDAISYGKGASIVRMVIEYIGEDAFRRGISSYIHHFKYDNARTVDLWKFLGEAAGMELGSVMENWTSKEGFPYLHVKKLSSDVTAAHTTWTLEIVQNRFTTVRAATDLKEELLWKVPLLIRTPDEPEEQQALVDQRCTQRTVKCSSWVKLNSRQTSFCRVLYDEALLGAIKSALLEKALPKLDRLGIMMDYSAFARNGYISTTSVMEIMMALAKEEDDYTVWSAIADFESDVRMIVWTRGESAVEKLNTYLYSLYAPSMERVGYMPQPGESQNVVRLRSLLFSRLCISSETKALEVARHLYLNREKIPIPSDLRQAVYTVHVREGGRGAVNETKSLIAATTDAVERARYLRALSADCPNSISVSSLFDYCFSDQVRTQDSLYLLAGIMQKPYLVKDYAEEIMKRWDQIIEKLPGFLVGGCIANVGLGADASVGAGLKFFWESRVSQKDKQIVGRSFEKGLEGLSNNAKWAERDADAIIQII